MLLAIVILVAAFGVWKLFSVNHVIVHAPGRVGEIQAETMKLLKSSWRQGNLLTLNEEDLESQLSTTDPILKSVQVRRQFMHGVVLLATIKQPSMGWASDNQRYLLDKDGTAIGGLPVGSALPLVNDGSNLPVKVGQQVVSSRFVSFVTGLTPGLAAQGLGVTALEVKDTTLDLTVSTNKGYKLLMDTSRPLEDELVDLKAVEGVLAAQKKAPAQYIDLRVSGKAYYQ
jgi:cell division septal protein FtsQ